MQHDSTQVLLNFTTADGILYHARFRESQGVVEFAPATGGSPEVRIPARSVEDAKRIAMSYVVEEWPDSTVH